MSATIDLQLMLEMDILSFHALIEATDKVQRRTMLNEAISARAAQADEKGWKSFTAALSPEDKKTGSADDFARLIQQKKL
jgi:hypothetical protein